MLVFEIYCKFGEDLLPTGGGILLTIFGGTGSQQVLITNANSRVMLFNFQYILKNSCTL